MKKLIFTSSLFILSCLFSDIFSQNFNRVDVTDNSNLIGYFNTRYGNKAGLSMTATSGSNSVNSDNSFIGYSAGANGNGTFNDQNKGNTMVGSLSGFGNTTGGFNSILGYYAGYYGKTASQNVFVGDFSGLGGTGTYTAGGSNTGIGSKSLNYITSGTNNIGVGYYAMGGSNTLYLIGTYNVAIGDNAGRYLTSADNNILIGKSAGYSSTSTNLTGDANIAIGQEAGFKLNTATYNTLLGYQSGYNLTTSSNNLFIGYQSGFSQSILTASNNSFVGYKSGYSNTTGTDNTYLGSFAGGGNFTTSNNTVLGSNAGDATFTTGNNTLIGSSAGTNNTAGNNSFIGSSAGFSNTTGTLNVMLGTNAGYYCSTSNRNVLIGHNAGYGLSLFSSQSDNTLVGYGSGQNTYGADNVMYGGYSGQFNTSGTSNVYVGKFSGGNIVSGNSNVFIGNNTAAQGANKATLNNVTVIGNNAIGLRNNTMILGDTTKNIQVGIGTSWPTQKLTIKGNFAFVAYNDGMFYKNKRFLFQDEQENIALGTNHEQDFMGKGNLLLGANSSLTHQNLNNSTAIGYGATVSVSNGFVLGNQDIHVGIGTSAPTARLEVASGKDGESGMVFSNLKHNQNNQYLTVNRRGEVILQKQRTQISMPEEWSDKVFESNYQLKSLNEVEDFVKINKHLPNIPSAQEMAEKGIENEKLSAKLLEKIEELTLYLIEMKKGNNILKNENYDLKTNNQKLENRLGKIEALLSVSTQNIVK